MPVRFGIVALICACLSAPVHASLIAGHDYVVINLPQYQQNKGKIEVIEFFSWGCPHCYEFYPMLSRWAATLPKDATFKRVPVSLGHPEWEVLAKMYYALQSTGDATRLDSQIFEDIHKNHVSLSDERSVTAWVGKHGVDVAKFAEAYRSFGVSTSAGQGDQQAADYRIPGVPALTVAGKYLVGGDHQAMLKTSDELIVMVRAESKKSGT